MQKLTAALNILTAVLFTAFFGYTFFAKAHLRSVAREFVAEKTLRYSEPVIETVEQALDVPLVEKLISEDDLKLVRDEIKAYRDDPAAYIADLTGQKPPVPPQGKLGAIAKKAVEAKEKIRAFYDATLASLVADLRIFSGTNVGAAVLAVVLTFRSRPPIRRSLIVFSFLLFVSVVFCSYLYIDGLSFFRILTSTHMGWWYPVFVLAVALGLYKDFGRTLKAAV